MTTIRNLLLLLLAMAPFGAAADEAREFAVRRPVRHLVSLDGVARSYHFQSCERFSPEGPLVIPAAATLRGHAAHPSCAAFGTIRQWRTETIRQAPKLTTRTNVLFVGNSLTYFNDLPWLVEQLSHAAGEARPVRAEFVGFGGATLEQQWDRGDALARIYGEEWDYVVLQEQSGRPILDPAETEESIGRFADAIRASGARTVIFAPWTTRSMRDSQELVNGRYASLAKANDALLAPVGVAWTDAMRLRPDVALYDSGGNHPTVAGSYLTACVIYSAIRGRSAAGLPHAFAHHRASIPADALLSDESDFMQRLAWRVVASIGRR